MWCIHNGLAMLQMNEVNHLSIQYSYSEIKYYCSSYQHLSDFQDTHLHAV